MNTSIVWFRQDLRLTDNPALYFASIENENIIPLYILEDNPASPIGGAQKWWLHHSLTALQQQCRNNGLNLVLKRGNPQKILLSLCKEKSVTSVYWNNCYEPAAIKRDMKIKKALADRKKIVKNYNGSLLHEPWEITNKQGTHFKIFTPFWKTCQLQLEDKDILPIPSLKQKLSLDSETLNTWKLLPTKPNWAAGWNNTWQPGELQAQNQLNYFIENLLKNYSKKRDFPSEDATSRMSPYLHFGEISPRQILNAIKHIEICNAKLTHACEQFLRQLGWREFSYHLLYYFPDLPEKNFRKEFDHFPWSNDMELLTRWQKGQTGYPIVDAGMRQLWQTGYMHNRVRMITASFLTKHLLIDWRHGEKWFLDTLVDADLANNAMNWQWVTGNGVDSAPYFRIFNPTLQGKKFDPTGEYVRQWVPELSKLANNQIHQPWQTSTEELQAANITLGKNYPKPIVEHTFARKRALESYKSIRALA